MSDSKTNVAFIRPEVRKLLPMYEEISDFIAGEKQVKSKGNKYLPKLNPDDLSPENEQRNKDYIDRAYLFNGTRKTLQSLVGLSLIREPVVELPESLNHLKLDASGTGITLNQLAKKAVSYNVGYSRGGVLVDFNNEGQASVDDVQSGRVRPTIRVINPASIINWQTIMIGGISTLSLVVIYEYGMQIDGFELNTQPKFTVLKLVPDDSGGYRYKKEEWLPKPDEDVEYSMFGIGSVESSEFSLKTTYEPVDANGNPLTTIPFMFFGAENNDTDVDIPEFYDIVSLNWSHFKDSADYQESCHRIGQPTPVVSGVDEHWVKEVMGGSVAYGSAAGIPLPAEGKAYFIQPQEHNMVRQAMKDKEEMMQKLGAKFVEIKSVQKTATEADLDDKKESSTLTTIVDNVSDCIQWACVIAAKFMEKNLDEDSVKFELNTDFDTSMVSSDYLRAASELYMLGQISWSELRAMLIRSGIATLDSEKAQIEIKGNIEFMELFSKKKEEPIEKVDKLSDNQNKS